MIHDGKVQDIFELDVDGISMKFSEAPEGVKVSTHVSYSAQAYENSWGTMVTSSTVRTSAAKETSLLTLSCFI